MAAAGSRAQARKPPVASILAQGAQTKSALRWALRNYRQKHPFSYHSDVAAGTRNFWGTESMSLKSLSGTAN